MTDIISKIDEIKRMLEDKLQRLRISANQIEIIHGISDISKRLGLFQSGELRFGNRVEPGKGFSGIRIGFPTFTYGSYEWVFAIVSNDAIQFGVDSTGTLRLLSDLWWEGEGVGLPYGSMGSEDLSILVPIAAANTYYAVGAGIAVGQLNLITFSNSTLTVEKAGRYLVNWSMSVSAGNNDHLEGSIMVNSTAQGSLSSSSHTPGPGDEVSVSSTGILDLAVGDVIKLCVENEIDADDITVHSAGLTLVMVGGT